MKRFKDFINEINMSGVGGVFGTGGQDLGTGGLVGNFDSYASGDSRVPQLFGIFSRAGKVAKRKKRHKLKNAIKRKSKGKRVGKRISGAS
jgi:hypothetical protein